MKNKRNILVGLILIAFGVIFGLNALGITDINYFFDGWWSMLIIIPSVLSLIRGKDVTGSLIGIVIGVSALLICQDIIDFELLWKIFIPVVLVIVGLRLVLKDVFTSKSAKRIKQLGEDVGFQGEHYATFSSKNVNFASQEFKGTDLNVAFGSIRCDLAFAIISEDCVINANSTFGDIKIILPPNVNAVVKSSSIFGGAEDKRNAPVIPGAPTVFVNASCIFGEVEVK